MNNRLKILGVFIPLCLMLCFMSNTYSRYVAGTTGNLKMSFAQWQILVNNEDIINNSSSSIVLTPVIDENENLKKMVSNHTLDITDSGKLSKVEVTLSDDTSQLHISNDNHLPSSSVLVNSEATIDQMKQYKDGMKVLTPTEKLVYELYISGNTTKEIMASLNIKENTLKFHNKNIYGKLGVSSRKQLIEMYKMIEQKKTAGSN